MLFSYRQPCLGELGICGRRTRERVLNHKDVLSGNFSGKAAENKKEKQERKTGKKRSEKIQTRLRVLDLVCLKTGGRGIKV